VHPALRASAVLADTAVKFLFFNLRLFRSLEIRWFYGCCG